MIDDYTKTVQLQLLMFEDNTNVFCDGRLKWRLMPNSPIHTADADATQLSSWVVSNIVGINGVIGLKVLSHQKVYSGVGKSSTSLLGLRRGAFTCVG